MYAEERQDAIAAEVRAHGRRSVVDLAVDHDVSTETVRRDLVVLERAGLLRRVHGGAVSSDALPLLERQVDDRLAIQSEQKERIARAAVDLLPTSGCLLIDAGTTTVRLAAHLPQDSRLTVLTHAVPVAARLAGHPRLELHLLPGRVRATTQAAVGADTVEALSRVRADVAVMGTNGISTGHGLSTPDHAEAATKRAMIGAALHTILLADSAKIGAESTVRFADLADIDILVTDDGITPDDRRSFEDAGIEVRVA